MFANDSGALCGDEGKEHHMMLIQGSSDATDYREGQAAGVTGQPHSSNDGEEKENADISADGKEEVKGDAQESPRYRLLKMAETVLNYCQLQMASETRCVRDTAYFRGTVAHLRSIFDKECAEERSHIEKLAEFSKMVHDMEQKYYAMKEKAKDLLVACRDEREKSEADYTAAVTRLQDIETELFSAQAIYSDQQKELAALKEASGQQISPIEVEKLRQQVAELEEKNKVSEEQEWCRVCEPV